MDAQNAIQVIILQELLEHILAQILPHQIVATLKPMGKLQHASFVILDIDGMPVPHLLLAQHAQQPWYALL